jgi:hypothetical protein
MKKNKIYITIGLLLLGVYLYAKNKKPKSRVIVDNPIKQSYAKKGSTVYKFDLITPIYTFNKEIVLTILEQDPNLPYTKVSFMANNVLKTGYIGDNNIINL